MSFPVILALVPLFFVMQNLSLLNTLPGLILVYIAYSLPFTVFFMTAFFRTLPTSVAEAAFVDGASHTRTFFQVMLPMAKPGLISIGIFNFLGQWNQYMLPTVLNTEPGREACPHPGPRPAGRQQGYKGDWSGLFAGLMIAMLPVLVVYIVFQRQVVRPDGGRAQVAVRPSVRFARVVPDSSRGHPCVYGRRRAPLLLNLLTGGDPNGSA